MSTSRISLLTIGLVAIGSVFAADQKPSPSVESSSPELNTVVQSLKPVLEQLGSEAKIEFPIRSESVSMTYRPQTFKVHGTSKTGEFNAEAHDEVGPSFTGLTIRAQLQTLGDINQAAVPQTLRAPYWTTDLDVTPLAKTKYQVLWSLSYSARTDKKLLDQVRTQLKGLKG